MSKLKMLMSLAVSAGLAHAGFMQSISIDLSALHPGSILSGSVILQSPPTVGTTVNIPLTFSDPTSYNLAALATTLTVTNGSTVDQFRFSPIAFMNLLSSVNPALNNKTYTLTVRNAAQCAVDFPCTATGGFQANDPAAFFGYYTVTSAPFSAPEPGYAILVGGLLTALACGRRLLRAE